MSGFSVRPSIDSATAWVELQMHDGARPRRDFVECGVRGVSFLVGGSLRSGERNAEIEEADPRRIRRTPIAWASRV